MPASVPTPKTIQRASARRFFAIIACVGAMLVFSAAELWRHDPVAPLWTALGYFGYELGLNALLVTAAFLGLRARSRRLAVAVAPDDPRPLTVLIAAHNELSCIFQTLESVFAQEGVRVRAIVASDGSADGMNEALAARYALEPSGPAEPHGWSGGAEGRLLLLALPKLGKGGVLNAALAHVQDEIVVTLDADTRLERGALRALAATFDDPQVEAAGGFIYVRNADGAARHWLPRYQYWEYLKNFMWRIGLVHLGVCLQVSGAFGAFRTGTLRAIGGFSGNSLVEDYEVIFRLHERLRGVGQRYRVEVAPGAVAYTDGPDTVASFVHQRTRWFAGFLQTMWDYRRMVGDARLGALGWFMLPVKCVDALLPAWGFVSLSVLVASAAAAGAAGAAGHWQRVALELYAARWVCDLVLSGVMLNWHRRLFPDRTHRMGAPRLAFHVATEGLVFNWFRQVAVLNAYHWFVRRVQRWHQPRWTAAAPQTSTE